jgi:hypothetical protein
MQAGHSCAKQNKLSNIINNEAASQSHLNASINMNTRPRKKDHQSTRHNQSRKIERITAKPNNKDESIP